MRCHDLLLLCIHLGAVIIPSEELMASLPVAPTAISGSCCSCGHPSPSPASAVSGQGFPPHFPLLLLIALGSWWFNSCLKLRAAISLKCCFPECSRELCMKRPTAWCAGMLLPPPEDSRDAAYHSWPIVQSVNCSVQLYVGPLCIMHF